AAARVLRKRHAPSRVAAARDGRTRRPRRPARKVPARGKRHPGGVQHMVMKPPPLPPIRGLEPMSLTAWEGRVAAVVSLQACNFNCPACPVPHLVPAKPELGAIPVESVVETIHRRRR